MAAPKKPENHVKHLEKQIAEAKTILTCLVIMELNANFPASLKDRINQFLNITQP